MSGTGFEISGPATRIGYALGMCFLSLRISELPSSEFRRHGNACCPYTVSSAPREFVLLRLHCVE